MFESVRTFLDLFSDCCLLNLLGSLPKAANCWLLRRLLPALVGKQSNPYQGTNFFFALTKEPILSPKKQQGKHQFGRAWKFKTLSNAKDATMAM